MTFPRARLTVAAVLFVAWLGYLLCLVLLSRHTIVLSRPQFIAADVWVLAEVSDAAGKPAKMVKVVQIFKPPVGAEELRNKELLVDNLPEAAQQGYLGPGKYLLPLDGIRRGAGIPFALIQLVPRNAGFEPAFVNVRLWSLGKNGDADRVAALAAEYLGVTQEQARARLSDLLKRQTPAVILAREVPREHAVDFLKKLHEVAQDAEANLLGDDVRIYPWSPEVKEQLEELLK